jgi:hypothetical protein
VVVLGLRDEEEDVLASLEASRDAQVQTHCVHWQIT